MREGEGHGGRLPTVLMRPTPQLSVKIRGGGAGGGAHTRTGPGRPPPPPPRWGRAQSISEGGLSESGKMVKSLYEPLRISPPSHSDADSLSCAPPPPPPSHIR